MSSDSLFVPLKLADARKLIAANASNTTSETVCLKHALGRIPVHALPAKTPQPGYDQSTRDGYVVSDGSREEDEEGCWYDIEGEIPAGSTETITLARGAAYRIMTGGLIPDKGVRVIPQEDCFEKGKRLCVNTSFLQQPSTFIRRRGCDVQSGEIITGAGMPLTVDQLALLLETGHIEVQVYRRPHVAFFCTGSELVSLPSELKPGKKVSANRILLDGLVRSFGGVVENLGLVADTIEDVKALLRGIDFGKTKVIISTGGLGPGKYDLMEEIFLQLGGKILYRSLKVRPGKSTLFGLLGQSLYFGLPGPPPTVRSLFNELLRPALLSLQGMKHCDPTTIKAHLQEPIFLKKTGVLNLKAGIVTTDDGRWFVRGCTQLESPSAFILLHGDRQEFKKGDLVDVHLVTSPFSGTTLES